MNRLKIVIYFQGKFPWKRLSFPPHIRLVNSASAVACETELLWTSLGSFQIYSDSWVKLFSDDFRWILLKSSKIEHIQTSKHVPILNSWRTSKNKERSKRKVWHVRKKVFEQLAVCQHQTQLMLDFFKWKSQFLNSWLFFNTKLN